jgi:cell division protein FtsN
MHVHGVKLDPNLMALNAAYSAQKAQSKKEAEIVRQKLREASSRLTGESDEPWRPEDETKNSQQEEPQEESPTEEAAEAAAGEQNPPESAAEEDSRPGDAANHHLSEWL